MGTAEDTRVTWLAAFLQALEFDTWGQAEEAVERYHRLQVAAAAVGLCASAHMRVRRRTFFHSLAQ
jgi:hypothetical protein